MTKFESIFRGDHPVPQLQHLSCAHGSRSIQSPNCGVCPYPSSSRASILSFPTALYQVQSQGDQWRERVQVPPSFLAGHRLTQPQGRGPEPAWHDSQRWIDLSDSLDGFRQRRILCFPKSPVVNNRVGFSILSR
jgi:hypothetical protein